MFNLLVDFAWNVVWSFQQGNPFRHGKIYFFLLAASLLVCQWLWRRFDPFIAVLYFFWFGTWLFYDVENYGVLSAVLPLVFLFVADKAVEKRQLFFFLLRSMVLFQCALSIPNVFFNKYFFFDQDQRLLNTATGTIGHFTVYGAFLGSLFGYACERWTKYEAGLIGFCVLLSGSTMSIVAAVASFVALALKKSNFRNVALISAFCLFAFLFFAALLPKLELMNDNGRLRIWAIAINNWKEMPFFGWGPGAWSGLYPKWNAGTFGGKWGHLHFDWLEILFHGGAVCFALSVIAYARLIVRASPATASILAGLGANAVGNFTWQVPTTGFLMAAAVAIATKEEHLWMHMARWKFDSMFKRASILTSPDSNAYRVILKHWSRISTKSSKNRFLKTAFLSLCTFGKILRGLWKSWTETSVWTRS